MAAPALAAAMPDRSIQVEHWRTRRESGAGVVAAGRRGIRPTLVPLPADCPAAACLAGWARPYAMGRPQACADAAFAVDPELGYATDMEWPCGPQAVQDLTFDRAVGAIVHPTKAKRIKVPHRLAGDCGDPR